MNLIREMGVFDNRSDALVFESESPIKIDRLGNATIDERLVSDEELGKELREWVKRYFELTS